MVAQLTSFIRIRKYGRRTSLTVLKYLIETRNS